VKDGKIVATGRQLNYTGEKMIDATGLIVAPGFIDVHTHLEGDETKDPNATNFILDGVTTASRATAARQTMTLGNTCTLSIH
jgi:N-acyl-D-amino-acid deacylase